MAKNKKNYDCDDVIDESQDNLIYDYEQSIINMYF